MRSVHNFSNDRHTGCFFGFNQQLQTFLSQTLEGIRGGSRLERTAAEQTGTGSFDRLRHADHLRMTFHRARPCNHLKMTAADFSAADINDRILRMEAAVGFFIWFCNAIDLCDNLICFHIFRVNGGGVAYKTDKMFFNTVNFLGFHVHGVDALEKLINFVLRNILFQKNNHTVYPFTR